jgi:hypothetical protein
MRHKDTVPGNYHIRHSIIVYSRLYLMNLAGIPMDLTPIVQFFESERIFVPLKPYPEAVSGKTLQGEGIFEIKLEADSVVFVHDGRQEGIGIAVYIPALIGACMIPPVEIFDLGGSQYHFIRIADTGNPEFRTLHFFGGSGNHPWRKLEPALLRLCETECRCAQHREEHSIFCGKLHQTLLSGEVIYNASQSGNGRAPLAADTLSRQISILLNLIQGK